MANKKKNNKKNIKTKTVKTPTIKAKTIKTPSIKAKTVKPKTIKAKTVKPKTIKAKTVKTPTIKAKTVKPKKNIITKKLKGHKKLLDEKINLISYNDFLDKYEVLNEIKNKDNPNTIKLRNYDDKKIYEMRIIKILEEDLIENYNENSIWRYKYFLSKVNNNTNNNTNKFFNIKDEFFIQFCDYIPNKFDLNKNRIYKKSKYCYVIIRDLIDNNLENILFKSLSNTSSNTKNINLKTSLVNKNQLYSIIIQLLDLYKIINNNNFTYNINNNLEINTFSILKNIYVRHSNANIKLTNNKDLKTYNGYQIYLPESLNIEHNLFNPIINNILINNQKNIDLNEMKNNIILNYQNELIRLNVLIYFINELSGAKISKYLKKFIKDLYESNKNNGSFKYFFNLLSVKDDKKDVLDDVNNLKVCLIISLLLNKKLNQKNKNPNNQKKEDNSEYNFYILDNVKKELLELFEDLLNTYEKYNEAYTYKFYKYKKTIINTDKASKYKQKIQIVKEKISNLKIIVSQLKKNNYVFKTMLDIPNNEYLTLIYENNSNKLFNYLNRQLK